jgi:hypothetical protein
VFCYGFFSRFCESQGADASTHDRLFTYSEQNRPDKSQRVNVPLVRGPQFQKCSDQFKESTQF